jgi:hypothetical protein
VPWPTRAAIKDSRSAARSIDDKPDIFSRSGGRWAADRWRLSDIASGSAEVSPRRRRRSTRGLPLSFGQYVLGRYIRNLFQAVRTFRFTLKESQMKRQFAEETINTTHPRIDMPSRSADVAHELSPGELDAVYGGELNIEMPAYIPLSQSHPKTETVLPRVPYK